MERAIARSLVAEFIGTFALVFAGAGAIMVDAKTHALGHVGVAITFAIPRRRTESEEPEPEVAQVA